MLFAIHAFEEIYQGSHGMDSYAVIEAMNETEAEEVAIEMSYDVINSYDDIYNTFTEEAELYGIKPGSDEWDDYINDSIKDDISYSIYELKENTLSLEELNESFYNDPEEFLNKYVKDLKLFY